MTECSSCPTFSIISETYTVYLKKPHYNNEDKKLNKNINRFNFWSGSYAVHDDGIRNQPLILKGIEFIACTDEMCFPLCFPICFTTFSDKFEFILSMSNNNEEVTISGLGDCIDAVYIIKRFSFETLTPSSRSWTMRLEKVR